MPAEAMTRVATWPSSWQWIEVFNRRQAQQRVTQEIPYNISKPKARFFEDVLPNTIRRVGSASGKYQSFRVSRVRWNSLWTRGNMTWSNCFSSNSFDPGNSDTWPSDWPKASQVLNFFWNWETIARGATKWFTLVPKIQTDQHEEHMRKYIGIFQNRFLYSSSKNHKKQLKNWKNYKIRKQQNVISKTIEKGSKIRKEQPTKYIKYHSFFQNTI